MGDVQVDALRGIDFEIKNGEFLVILGESGSGKSTLLNIMGMKIKEVMEIIRFEVLIEWIIGTVAGIGFAIILKKIMMNFFVIAEELKVPDNVTWPSYVWATIILIFAIVISDFIIKKMIRNFELTEILKERD